MTTTAQPSTGTLAATRRSLHLVAVHLLARRRYGATGRFGLRSAPAGFTTGAFGSEPETLRVSGGALVYERGPNAALCPMDGSSLDELAGFAGADLDADFSAGGNTPPMDDRGAALVVDDAAAAVVADWYELGWRALDSVVTALPASAEPAVIQLWPEHFDAATSVAAAPESRANLGFSPGDSFVDEPYVYVGPWGDERPGDDGYWNAPFGAVLRRSEVTGSGDALVASVDFLQRGLVLLSRS